MADRLNQLTMHEVFQILEGIREALWFDEDRGEWDEDKEWSSDTLQEIAGIFYIHRVDIPKNI